MSRDLAAQFRAAAGAPSTTLDMARVMDRGRTIRRNRSVLVSAVAIVALGIGWYVVGKGPASSPEPVSPPTPQPSISRGVQIMPHTKGGNFKAYQPQPISGDYIADLFTPKLRMSIPQHWGWIMYGENYLLLAGPDSHVEIFDYTK